MGNAKKLTRLALLTAVSLAVYLAEARLPPIAPVPGIKLGLANAVTLFALLVYGTPAAAMVSLGRILLGGFAAGSFSTLLYSLTGGAVAFAAMTAARRRAGIKRAFITGALGGAAHNIAQLSVAAAVTETPEIFAYLPILIASGAIAGAFTGLCAGYSAKRLGKLM
ncbi:MAG: Gx transporter family protein [Oscillospiraceae bacterium]|jgi:heptaprenyl diphosphate synthase|nr:Gx transporter family protein [Oscillospiraceae bacterium]